MDIYNSAICVPVLFILRTVNWKKNYMHDNYFNMQLDFWLLHIKSTHAATQYICLIVFLIVQIFIICKKKTKKTNNKQDIYKAAFHFLKFSIWFVVSINFVEYYMYHLNTCVDLERVGRGSTPTLKNQIYFLIL